MDNYNIPANDKKKQFCLTNRGLLSTISVIVFLFVGLWIWKAVEIKNIKAGWMQDKARLRDSCKVIVQQSEVASLKLLAKPYVWAVREKMLRNNMEQIDLYSNELVKEKNVLEVMVVDSKGIVTSATNKKNDGKEFITIQSPYYLQTDSTVVQKISDSIFIMASPVMSFNSRLGTAVIMYKTKSI